MKPEAERLQKLLEVFNSGGVKPEELIDAIQAVLKIVREVNDKTTADLKETDSKAQSAILATEQRLTKALEKLKKKVSEKPQVVASDLASVRAQFSKEIESVRKLIPTLPPEFDAQPIYSSLKEQRSILDNLSILIVGENLRNALEALPEGEKLAIDAIENLREELDKRQETVIRETTALIARNLYQIGDVNVAGAADGDVLTYDSTTNTWTAEAPTGGGGTPGGADTQIQFNDGGSFGGDAGFTWDKTDKKLGFVEATTPNRVLNLRSKNNVNWDGENTLVISNFDNDEIITPGQTSILVAAADTGALTEGFLISSLQHPDGYPVGEFNPFTMETGESFGQMTFSAGEGRTELKLEHTGTNPRITLFAGEGVAAEPNSNGGDVQIRLGEKSGTGRDGRLFIQAKGSNTIGSILDFDDIASTDKTFTFPNESGTIALIDTGAGTSVNDGNILFAPTAAYNNYIIQAAAQTTNDTVGNDLSIIAGATNDVGETAGGSLILNAAPGSLDPTGGGTGGGVYLDAGAGGIDAAGGELRLRAGDANNTSLSGPGGQVNITSGDAYGTGDAGYFLLQGGDAFGDGDGATIDFDAGDGGPDGGNGGDVVFNSGKAGVGSGGNGGSIRMFVGPGDGAGTRGTYELRSNQSPDVNYAVFDFDDLYTDTSAVPITFSFPNESGTIALLSDIPAGSGITRTITTTSGNYTAGSAAATDYVYFISGAHTTTMPTAVGNTNRYTFKNNHSANVTIDGAGAETIEGAANISLAPGESVDLVSDGDEWFVL